MDNKKLVEVIKLIVEKEVKRQLPNLIKEEVSKQVKLLKEIKPSKLKKNLVEEEVYDPFEMANMVLEEDRVEQKTTSPSFLKGRQLTKNPVLNEVLAQTQPFTHQQRSNGLAGNSSVLDQFSQSNMLNEETGYEEWPTMNTAFQPQFQEDPNQVRVNMRAQMEQQMGLSGGSSRKNGLGVTTGLAGLDRILNRDNSELVKRFKK
jgi:hypothetical protein